MPWKSSGETNVLLHHIASALEDMRCPCGCGQWADEAHDPDTDGLWVVDQEACYARRALIDHAKDDPPAWVLAGVHLDRDAMARLDAYREGAPGG